MLQRILATGKKVGTPVGLHVQSVEAVRKRISEGWQFIALQSELKMRVSGAPNLATELDLKRKMEDIAPY